MRLSYIDTAKFLAIYFVLIGHACITSPLASFLFSFHVQMFFILYGFVHIKRKYTLKELYVRWKKLFVRLMVPYTLLVFILGSPLSVTGFLKMLYGTTWIIYHPGSLHLWFLPCFFVSAVIFEFLRSKELRRSILFVVLVAFGIISSFLNWENDIVLKTNIATFHFTGFNFSLTPVPNEYYIGFPYYLNVAMTGVIFMYIGSGLRILFDKIHKIHLISNQKYVIILFLISLSLGFFSFLVNQNYLPDKWSLPVISMGASVYGNYILFIVTSVLLTISTVCISIVLNNRYFSKIGKSTMEIYAFHMVFLPIITMLLIKMNIPEVFGITSATICMIICSLLIPLFDYFIPSLKGYNPSKK